MDDLKELRWTDDDDHARAAYELRCLARRLVPSEFDDLMTDAEVVRLLRDYCHRVACASRAIVRTLQRMQRSLPEELRANLPEGA